MSLWAQSNGSQPSFNTVPHVVRTIAYEGSSIVLMAPDSITSLKQNKKLTGSCSVVLIYAFGLRFVFKDWCLLSCAPVSYHLERKFQFECF